MKKENPGLEQGLKWAMQVAEGNVMDLKVACKLSHGLFGVPGSFLEFTLDLDC